MESNLSYLEPELMDVVRLFDEAKDWDIRHLFCEEKGEFQNVFIVNGKEYSCSFSPDENEFSRYEKKSLIKRYAKLTLYRILQELTKKTLPWGSLTGIRPTRLAYSKTQYGEPFEPFFRTLCVSEENIALTGRVLAAQRGIYERREGNCDLYVSLPFCPTRCVYCSFITAPIEKTRSYIPAYLAALERELESARKQIKNLRSVYIGGGTPFALTAEELRRVFEAVAPLRANGCEYTVEAGRADVFTKEKIELCKEYGVTRLCINAQSFTDKTLEAIGRKHTAQQVIEAFALARPYGFILNCDLIAGLTDESVEEFKNSIDTAISLAPENITVHTLCLKKGAKLKEETASLAEGNLSAMIAYSREKLTLAGYEPYYLYRQKYMAGAHENVGWAKKGCASVYNIDVMEEAADNLAVGANAISKRVILKENRIERYGSPKDIPTYLQKVEKIIEEKKKLFG